MRMTLLAVGSRGDVQPYIALGVGLQSAGYQVRIATHSHFEALVRERGLEFFLLRGNIREILGSHAGQALIDRRTSFTHFLRDLKRALGRTMELVLADSFAACTNTDVILYSPLAFAGPHLPEKLHVPSIPAFYLPLSPSRAFPFIMAPPSLHLGPLYNVAAALLAEQVSWQAIRADINRWRQLHLRLPPASLSSPLFRLAKQQNLMLYGYSPQVLPKPHDWGAWIEVTGYWFLDRRPQWEPPPALVQFLAAGPPPVYVGFGSMMPSNPERLARTVLEALQATGERGILATGWSDLTTTLSSDRILIVEDIPHDWLFPQVSAVVHHGGAGTTAAGLRAGVPTIIAPFFVDQPFWGHRVATLGVGPTPIPHKELTTQRLITSLDQARKPQMQAQAADLGTRIRQEDGVARAVSCLQRYLQGATPV